MAEQWLAATPLPALARRRRAGDLLVLAYHNVVPRDARPGGDRSLHLPRDRFAAQLDALLRTHDVVPLGDALRPARGRRPRAAITFDDGYRGALTEGVAELAARGLPATFFVVPAAVPDRAFWWDALAPGAGDAVPAPFRRLALEGGRGVEAEVRALAAAAGLAPAEPPPWMRAAGEAELHAAARVPGITLGSHSWSHPNLARLPDDELRHELRAPLDWLRARFGAAALPWLSYPYGLCTPAVARAAAEAGYAGALRVEGGWLRGADRAAPPFALPRLNVPAGVSAHGFALRAAGVLG